MNNLFPSPPGQVARVGAARVAVIHGDPDSLAGWGFGVEMVTPPPPPSLLLPLPMSLLYTLGVEMVTARPCPPPPSLLLPLPMSLLYTLGVEMVTARPCPPPPLPTVAPTHVPTVHSRRRDGYRPPLPPPSESLSLSPSLSPSTCHHHHHHHRDPPSAVVILGTHHRPSESLSLSPSLSPSSQTTTTTIVTHRQQ